MKNVLGFLALWLVGTVHGETLQLAQSIPLPGVEGRIDHLSLDVVGARLFVAALGNNTVEVVDLKAGKVVRSLAGFSEPQGVLFVPESDRLYVANGGDGAVHVVDAATFQTLAAVKFDDDADNLRYDPAARQVYVGYGSGALGIIDATKNTVVGTISLTAHPESFQLEQNGARVFINVPGSHTIAVADRASRHVVAHWSLGFVAANFPMAIDQAHHRVFVGCRRPAHLLVFDADSGKQIAKRDLHGDCDDVFFDATRHQIYASCGEGFIDVFGADGDHYTPRAAVKTTPRARTCYFAGDHLYLAVPRQGTVDAHIDVYDFR